MPNDIRLGSLQDQWLMSAVSAICESTLNSYFSA
jgi:hypothetical protein